MEVKIMIYIICDSEKKREILTFLLNKYNILWASGSTIKEYPIPKYARYIVFNYRLSEDPLTILHGRYNLHANNKNTIYDILDNTKTSSLLNKSKYELLTEEKFVKIIEGLRNEES